MFKSKTFLNLADTADSDGSSSSSSIGSQPLPTEFERYLPWACLRLQQSYNVVITKKYQPVPVAYVTDRSSRGKSRLSHVSKSEKSDMSASPTSHAKEPLKVPSYGSDESVVTMTALYDNLENLVQIKFDKNSDKPQSLIKLIGILVEYYHSLSSIVVEPPITKYVAYELKTVLQASYITEVCFDGCYLKECNYYVLLEDKCNLKSLSLARCNINDDVLGIIFLHLRFPAPASMSLRILNLTSNKITDLGAQHIAYTLRSNRQLCCLNLSDNMITDDGSSNILDALTEFPLTVEELNEFRKRQQSYQKAKLKLIEKYFVDFKEESEKKPKVASVGYKNKARRRDSFKSLETVESTNINAVDVLLEKAKDKAEAMLGAFDDPFSEMYMRDGDGYSLGNNTLQILNLSYNHLTYFSLKKLSNVLFYQKLMDRRPRGLLHVSLNGNLLPVKCNDWLRVQELLETAVINTVNSPKGSTASKKKSNKGLR